MPDPPIQLRPRELLAALHQHEVEFVVIGGMSLAVHGYVRATKDLDVMPDPVRPTTAMCSRKYASTIRKSLFSVVDVATALTSAQASLETVMAVRDQVISAYQEILRMPI